jgi:hypothetical protein
LDKKPYAVGTAEMHKEIALYAVCFEGRTKQSLFPHMNVGFDRIRGQMTRRSIVLAAKMTSGDGWEMR